VTIKAPRAKALRKMDHKEAASYNTRVWVDESFPVDAVRQALAGAGEAVDVKAFEGFFGPRLGRYRVASEWQQEQPSTAKELELLDEACEAIEQVRIRLAHLPPAAGARIEGVTWKRRHEFFHAFRRRLDAELEEARNLLWLTEREVEVDGGKAGRKPATPLTSFLHDVVHWLNGNGVARKTLACELAAAVLRAVAVDVSEDPKYVARLVRTVEKEREEIDRN
jgi:hypothetical protein